MSAVHARDVAGRRIVSALRTVAADATVVVLGIVVYFGVRGLTAGSPDVARENAYDLLAVEDALGLDIEARVQQALVGIEVLTTLANWIYIWGHWPAIVITLVWLALHDRRVFLRMRNAMIASGAVGLAFYTTYPVAPPRLMDLGFVDTVSEQSSAYRVLQPPAFVNQYAAFPSLHVGWDLVLGLAVVSAAGTVALRRLGQAMPVLMAAATVLTANHYVLDVVAGAAVGLLGWAVALRLERRREGAGSTTGAERAVPVASPVRPPVPVPSPRCGTGAGERSTAASAELDPYKGAGGRSRCRDRPCARAR